MSTPLEPKQQEVLQTRTAIVPVIEIVARYGTLSVPLIDVSGSITIDRRRVQRTTCDLTVIVTDDVPAVLTPLGTNIDIRLGVRTIDGTFSMVPVATGLSVTGVNGVVRKGGVLAVQASDRSERVARWRFPQPFPTEAGLDLAQVISLVLSNRGLASTLPNVGVTLTAARVFGLEAAKDPFAELCELAASFGWRLWINRSGAPVLDQPPLQPSPRDVLVLEPTTSQSGRPANVISGRWEPQNGTPIYSIAEDLDPASKTFIGGPYGPVTGFFASSLPITQAGADQATQALLAQERYQGASWSLELPFDPTIDPDDVLHSSNDAAVPNVQVDALTINLAGNVTVEGREVPT